MAAEPSETTPVQTRSCVSSATHAIYLEYEPRHERFVVHISGVHEFGRDNQRTNTHPFNRPMHKALRLAVADVCAKLSDHGLQEPQWISQRYVVLGDHVRDRDYVLLSIIDRLKEMRPQLVVNMRFIGTDCLNNCCR